MSQQVLDEVINNPFIDHFQQLCNNWLLRCNNALTLSGKLKEPSISMLGNGSQLNRRGFPVSQLLLDLRSAAYLMP
jgi:hypothetical protein